MRKLTFNLYKLLEQNTLCFYENRYVPCSIYKELNKLTSRIKVLNYPTEYEIQKYFHYPIIFNNDLKLSKENKIWNWATLIEFFYIKGGLSENQWREGVKCQKTVGIDNFLDTDNIIVTKEILYKLFNPFYDYILSDLKKKNIILYLIKETETLIENHICRIGIKFLYEQIGCSNYLKQKFKYESLRGERSAEIGKQILKRKALSS